MPNGLALTAIGAGSLFVWSGIKGWSLLPTVTDIISGKQPSGGNVLTLVSGSADGTGATGNAIADDALKYKGHPYVFGGAPGSAGNNPWDCSSFCNWVVGHDGGNAIPGIKHYDGTTHGPPTGSWAIWPGTRRVTHSELQAGDLIIWATHMGIYIGNNKMISARSPMLKTGIDDIPNPNKIGLGPVLRYGRIGG
jgi:cell wall-associated NlpC family hydrolase